MRASRDGHEFHETWTARKALQLLLPDTDLVALAVEGLSPADEKAASADAVEIADVTLYYGAGPSFDEAQRIAIAQFKYSIGSADEPFRVSDAKKTLRKFGTTYREAIAVHGSRAVADKLEFQLITNQPISNTFIAALRSIATGRRAPAQVQRQALDIKTAIGLRGPALTEFVGRLHLVGSSSDLPTSKQALASQLIAWSIESDHLARSRLGDLRDLVRKKAGYAGTGQNLILETDVMAALGLSSPDDLLPCPSALPDIGHVVEREQLEAAAALVTRERTPLLIHGSGGVGKTVLLQSIAGKLAHQHETLLFDCFGGGAYRSPEDARHLPQHGLLHIANVLACRGLCDPMLPGSSHASQILRAFRKRLEQCVATLASRAPGRALILLIDAADNADIAAGAKEASFPCLLLDMLAGKSMDGVHLVLSCRSERKLRTSASLRELELRPFSLAETSALLRARHSGLARTETEAAHAKCRGNPRVLDYLITTDTLQDVLTQDELLSLDDIISKRIESALGTAQLRGGDRDAIEQFFATMVLLPPPVPVVEMAAISGFDAKAVESFVADLAPLVEHGAQGLTFRDEPTETYFRDGHARSPTALRRVADGLRARQTESVYAARALPKLLADLGDGASLLELAFDDRFPAALTTGVGRRKVRQARLIAAVRHAAKTRAYDHLVQLAPELATMTEVNERGGAFLRDHPDLVAASGDPDAYRRLYETRSAWPGTRYARLAIANVLLGDRDEASRNVALLEKWIEHYSRNRGEHRRNAHPEHPDLAAGSLYLIWQQQPRQAARALSRWRPWYAFEVCAHIFWHLQSARSLRPEIASQLPRFLASIGGAGPIAAALAIHEDMSASTQRALLDKLAHQPLSAEDFALRHDPQRDRKPTFDDGLRKAACIALSLKLNPAAFAIISKRPLPRIALFVYRRSYHHYDVSEFLIHQAVLAAAEARHPHERDMLPIELASVCAPVPSEATGSAFVSAAKTAVASALEANARNPAAADEAAGARRLQADDRYYAECFLDTALPLLLALATHIHGIITAAPGKADAAFVTLVDHWRSPANKPARWHDDQTRDLLDAIELDVVFFLLWTRRDLCPTTLDRFAEAIEQADVPPEDAVELISVLSNRSQAHATFGRLARWARERIEVMHDAVKRADHLGTLARALLRVDREEANVCFRRGLEQLDAIGSSDYGFTAGLLSFASALRTQLDDDDTHTLSNICELNLGDEPEKFYWRRYGEAFARVAGVKSLAKISRWDDRERVSLEYTLLPLLTALVRDYRLDVRHALALNYLAKPAELRSIRTRDLAEAAKGTSKLLQEDVVELVRQYRADNTGNEYSETCTSLAALAREEGATELAMQLDEIGTIQADLTAVRNERSNYRPEQRGRRASRSTKRSGTRMPAVTAFRPADRTSLRRAIDAFNGWPDRSDAPALYFDRLRARVPFNNRLEYLRAFAELDNLYVYWKLDALIACKKAWSETSVAMADVTRDLAAPLIRLHCADMRSEWGLSLGLLDGIAEFSGLSAAEVASELIICVLEAGEDLSGADWMSLAAFFPDRAPPEAGVTAMRRLLRGDAGKLSNVAEDGPWRRELDPPGTEIQVVAGMIWRCLGAPEVATRWRAAHSVRALARLDRWQVIDELVVKLTDTSAGAFQCAGRPFYYLHARLWLLIAIARLAQEHPGDVQRYGSQLLCVARQEPAHLLIRSFAARALRSCIDASAGALSQADIAFIRSVDVSPHEPIETQRRVGSDFYSASGQERKSNFRLDYDFHKHNVCNLADVFGKRCAETVDRVGAEAMRLDPNASGMNEAGGRSHTAYGSGERRHAYGYQLGWHALMYVAARMLNESPVIISPWRDDSWNDWLRNYQLTRDDGHWLVDGTDEVPLDIRTILLEHRKGRLVLPSSASKMLPLIWRSRVPSQSTDADDEIIINGSWSSADDGRIEISSVLVARKSARRLGRRLAREKPGTAWLPTLDDDIAGADGGDEDEDEWMPWIVHSNRESRLDKHDPFASPHANSRSRLAQRFTSWIPLRTADPFGRTWIDSSGTVCLRSEAWGREPEDHSRRTDGFRLSCMTGTLQEILIRFESDLLLLIRLRQADEYGRSQYEQRCSHGVVRVSQQLEIEFFKG